MSIFYVNSVMPVCDAQYCHGMLDNSHDHHRAWLHRVWPRNYATADVIGHVDHLLLLPPYAKGGKKAM